MHRLQLPNAQVAELVDAHVSGACVERHAGSSPVLGTLGRSEERRVGKECRSRWSPYH